MLVICDIETERLDNPEKLWLVVCREVDTGAIHVFRNLHDTSISEYVRYDKDGAPPELVHEGSCVRGDFASLASHVTCWIGHNFLAFDRPHIERLSGYRIDHSLCIDTLVVSRLLNFDLEGGHSLAAWGDRLGCPKTHFKAFDAYSLEMELYCLQDTLVNLKIYHKLEPYIRSSLWSKSLRVEHEIAQISHAMHETGFAFDIETAKNLHQEISQKLEVLDQELQEAFPPRSCLIKEVTPKATKFGTISRVDFRWLENGDLSPFEVGCPFSRIEFVPFNAGSPKQIVERLNEAGWKPFEKTKGHIQAERDGDEEKLQEYRVYGWKVSEANLATLPRDAPEAARKLVERLLLASRKSTLEEWLKAFNEHTNRIHGSFNHIGAWTGRMSHARPNMANIPSGSTQYADQMRSLWCVPDDRLLVGVDADGIQLRVLAHYMDDPAFTRALVDGRKEDESDAHSMNKKALGYVCKSRDDAKTFIYAWLLGAGIPKQAQILGCTNPEAKDANDKFLDFYPALKDLKRKRIPLDAERGYFEGLDGRCVLCNNEHLMLAGYLQNGESVIMKHANVLWRARLIKERIPFWQVNFVHDEWQTETVNDTDVAKYIAQVQADAIKETGEMLGLKCPMAGSILNSHKVLAIGKNWSQTH